MRTLQALAVMAMWTIAMISIFNWIGFDDHYRQPIWALGAALVLIVTLVGNFWLFFAIAQEEPWDWVKGKGGGDE